MNDVTIILFGASGDLARRKIFPALYRLVAADRLTNFAVIGAALDDTTVADLLESIAPTISRFNVQAWQRLKDHTRYIQLDFRNSIDFKKLTEVTQQTEKEFGLKGNRLIYLATSSTFFCDITANIAEAGLAVRAQKNSQEWHRIVYEKPFGNDRQSADEINHCIKKYFDESQIYRIDHYLTKEVVSNIALVRFTNCIFEPLWNNRYIDQVQITISEDIGIENRGIYYDTYGALSDVMQNHMLQLVALIGMESPAKLTGDAVRSERLAVLKSVEIIDGILGQYEGYRQEKKIRPDSTTETFAALYLRIKNRRWAGVPFYLKTGKMLATKATIIDIKFKQVDCLLVHSCPVPSNWLRIEVAPDASFALSLNIKKPGLTDQVIPVAMEFCHSCLFGAITPEAYEVIIQEIINGEQSISVRFDEIEEAWRIIDAVRALNLPLYSYAQKSNGPHELITEFESKHGMRWKL